MKLSFISNKGVVNIDGREFSGSCIEISGNKVIVDGAPQDGELIGNVSVFVNGDIETLSLGSGIIDAANIGSIDSGSGNINCKDVSGNIETGTGDIVCEAVGGSVTTSTGDVKCHSIAGNVKTSTGDIIKRY